MCLISAFYLSYLCDKHAKHANLFQSSSWNLVSRETVSWTHSNFVSALPQPFNLLFIVMKNVVGQQYLPQDLQNFNIPLELVQ